MSDDLKSNPGGGALMEAAQVKGMMGLMGLRGFGGERKLRGFGFGLKNEGGSGGGDVRIAMEEKGAAGK